MRPEVSLCNEFGGHRTHGWIAWRSKETAPSGLERACVATLYSCWCLGLRMYVEIVVDVPEDKVATKQASKVIHEAFDVTLNGVQFKMDINTGSSWSRGKDLLYWDMGRLKKYL